MNKYDIWLPCIVVFFTFSAQQTVGFRLNFSTDAKLHIFDIIPI